MLDPFTSLSLASAIVQLVDFSSKLLSKSTELYRSTALSEYVELEKIAADLNDLNAKLLTPPQPGAFAKPLSDDEVALKQLATRSKVVSDELIAVLQDLKTRNPAQKWQSFRQALKSVRKREKIQALERGLDQLQENIHTHLVNIMRMQQSSIVSSLKELREQSNRTYIVSVDRLEGLQTEILATLQPLVTSDAKLGAKTGQLEPGNVGKHHSLCKETFDTAKNSGTVPSDGTAYDNLHRLLSAFIEEGKQMATTHRILESLYFKEFREREFNVKKSHASTYHWIFNKNGAYEGVAFKDWLESGSSIYWIAGKAGSGKSTFMKLIINHPQTREALQVWRILRQCPTLIKIACPSRCQANQFVFNEWSKEELSLAFEQLPKQASQLAKICIFVDGLDEYSGEHRDILSILQRAGTSQNIKLCLSSRPWNVFQNAFGESDNRLMLQRYTKNDIRSYVFDTLCNDEQFERLVEKNQQAYDLQNQIADKANGVFLWVFLVVHSLLSGLTDDNTIAELQQRVNELPEDLEDYFKLLLSNIEPFYRAQTAHIFLVSLQAVRPQSIVEYSFLEDVVTDPDFALGDMKPLTDDQISLMYEKQRKHLNARCKDLLEITEAPYGSSFMKYKVDFLHRTVRDFLNTSDIYSKLEGKAARNFDVRKTLCRVHLAHFKAYSLGSNYNMKGIELTIFFREILRDAYEIEVYHGISETALLDELDRVASETFPRCPRFCQKLGAVDDDGALSSTTHIVYKATHEMVNPVLSTAIEASLVRYITYKLDENPTLLFKKRQCTLLFHATGNHIKFDKWTRPNSFFPNIEIIRVLLEHGANPNERMGKGPGITAWSFFLHSCLRRSENKISMPTTGEDRKQIFQIAEMMIKHGADMDLRLTTIDREMCEVLEDQDAAVVILSHLLEWTDRMELERLMEEKRRADEGPWSR